MNQTDLSGQPSSRSFGPDSRSRPSCLRHRRRQQRRRHRRRHRRRRRNSSTRRVPQYPRDRFYLTLMLIVKLITRKPSRKNKIHTKTSTSLFSPMLPPWLKPTPIGKDGLIPISLKLPFPVFKFEELQQLFIKWLFIEFQKLGFDDKGKVRLGIKYYKISENFEWSCGE